ncbi:hypothetical protein PNOK_0746700 [Pyrrhoderma noxium]|uniref:Uncharacterized protein n=1 Tax=Pyrrhoderma noxium TaxID=2282107 RepID=A0A286UCT5_9AGAM|nr:hypothetical protein PNOK_0746700 [Pyrrhoderma noxium]
MSPTSILVGKEFKTISHNIEEVADNKEYSHDFWSKTLASIISLFSRINSETLEHPYYISFALVVLWAYPHLLMLPVWFSHDAVRRMDDHVRNAADQATAPVRRRKRDVFISKYHAIVNASYNQSSRSTRPLLFGGTPLSSGDFRVEEERHLPVALRIIRWCALSWACLIIGRELVFFFLQHS